MKTLYKPFLIAIAALLLVQLVAVAAGQDTQEHQSTQRRERKRTPRPPADNSDIKLAPASLEIQAENTTAKIGEKLKVEATITNTSDGDIFYDGTGFERMFGLEVHDETGAEVARRPSGSGAGNSYPVAMHPGESIRQSAWLDKEFLLDKPGNYFVQATRGFSKTNLQRSNTITITIVQ